MDESASNTSRWLAYGLFALAIGLVANFVLQADLDSWESAETNNDRSETQEWSQKLNELIEDEPKYENPDVLRDF